MRCVSALHSLPSCIVSYHSYVSCRTSSQQHVPFLIPQSISCSTSAHASALDPIENGWGCLQFERISRHGGQQCVVWVINLVKEQNSFGCLETSRTVWAVLRTADTSAKAGRLLYEESPAAVFAPVSLPPRSFRSPLAPPPCASASPSPWPAGSWHAHQHNRHVL